MRCTSLAAPYLGDEIKVQTMVPLWAERHREGGGGGGVAPGCKALAEETWGGTPASPDRALCPSTADAWGTPSSAHWVLGGSHLSSSEGSTAMRGQRPKVARLWGRGWGCPQPLVAQLDKGGQAVGIRHFNPLALTSHLHWLSWAGGRVGGGLPSQGLVDGHSRPHPFLGSSGSLRSASPKPLPPKVHFLQCVQCGSLPGGVEPAGRMWWGWGGGWGWPPMPRGGGGGQLHRDFSSQIGRRGAERQSPESAQHRTLWGGWRSHNRLQDTPEKESATCPCALVTPGISHNPLLPLSHPCPPWHPWGLPTGLETPAWEAQLTSRQWVTVGMQGEVSLLGVLPHRAWAQAPGCAHLVLGGGGSGRLPFQSSSKR